MGPTFRTISEALSTYQSFVALQVQEPGEPYDGLWEDLQRDCQALLQLLNDRFDLRQPFTGPALEQFQKLIDEEQYNSLKFAMDFYHNSTQTACRQATELAREAHNCRSIVYTMSVKLELLNRPLSEEEQFNNLLVKTLDKHLLPDWTEVIEKGYTKGSYLYETPDKPGIYSFRFPGATRGHVKLDDNWKLLELKFYEDVCFPDTAKGIACYDRSVKSAVLNLMGEFILPPNNRV